MTVVDTISVCHIYAFNFAIYKCAITDMGNAFGYRYTRNVATISKCRITDKFTIFVNIATCNNFIFCFYKSNVFIRVVA